MAAVGLLDGDFHVGAAVEPPYVVQCKRAGRHHGGIDQRTVLPHFDLGLTVGYPLDHPALSLDLQGLLVEHLQAGNLRTRQDRVVEVDLAGLEHRLMAGEGSLCVGGDVYGARHIVLPGLYLAAAYDPVSGVETHFGIGRGVATGVIAIAAVLAGHVIIEQGCEATGLVAGYVKNDRANGVGGNDQGQRQIRRVLFDGGLW
ncbi:hypothetical protein D3C73_1038200 [compost metagenome]